MRFWSWSFHDRFLASGGHLFLRSSSSLEYANALLQLAGGLAGRARAGLGLGQLGIHLGFPGQPDGPSSKSSSAFMATLALSSFSRASCISAGAISVPPAPLARPDGRG
jgi:hypothetical protein